MTAKQKRAQRQRYRESAATRARDPKTPLAQLGSDAAYPDEEDEEEVNECVMEPSSDLPIEAEAEGTILGLGSVLPDLRPASRDAQGADMGDDVGHHKRGADMGANQSHEETIKSLRSASQQLQKSNATAQSSREKPGRLKKPSSSNAKFGTTKRLGPANRTRKSAYDALIASPEKFAPPTRQPTNATAFSPRRAEKKAQRAEAQPKTGPRRSDRVQAQQDAQETAVALDDLDQTAQEQDVDDADAMYRDRFPDPIVQQYQQPELDADAGAEDGDNIDVADYDQEVQGQQQAEPAHTNDRPKNKGGRPKKKSRKANSNTDGKKAPESQPDAAQQTPQRASAARPTVMSQSKSSARAQRLSTELARRNGSGEVPQTWPKGMPKAIQGSTAQSSRRRSSRIDQSVADLNRRRNEQPSAVPAKAAPAAAEGGDVGPVDDGHDDGEELPDQPLIPRISQVHFDNDNCASEDTGEFRDDVPEASTPKNKKRKRKATPQGAQANTGAKRRRQANPEDDEHEDSDEQQGLDDRRAAKKQRLWGQWLPLTEIYSNLEDVGCNTEGGELMEQRLVDLDDKDVKTIVNLCTEAKKRYQTLMSGDADTLEPASVLEGIGQRVDGLRSRNEDFPTDFEDETKVTNIYSHLIPALVRLIVRAVKCYQALDKDEVATGEISMNHLQIVQGLIRLTLDMEGTAGKDYKVRPDSKHAVVRPVHNGIAVPLLKVSQAFQKVLQRHRAEVQATQRRQQEAQDRALRLEQEERRSRQAAELYQIRQKWEQLHRERMAAEGGMMRPAKMAHLRMPDPNLDVDAEGMTFRRVSLFHPRVGPPPGLVDRAKQLIWTEGELRALEDGLMRYAGRMVYERTFRAWCPRGRILNKYNVTEIVAAAEMMKEAFEGVGRESGVEVEEWVKAIPVWGKGNAGGEENEEGFADVDEVVGGGSAAAVATGSS